jgi:hypothetical protein
VRGVIHRLGLAKLAPLRAPEPANRYERPMPGELIHIDVKKLGRIGRPGHRVHGDRTTRGRGIGWEFVHVCIDDCTRLAYVEVIDDERKETVTAFLKRAVGWFAAHGVMIERLMTVGVTQRTVQEKARDWGGHLHWEVKQLCQLGVRLEDMRRGGKAELPDAVDAAVLESFVLHARSLIEFLWHSEDPEQRRWRKSKEVTDHGAGIIGKRPYTDDVLAEHYFDEPALWQPGSMSRCSRPPTRSRTGASRTARSGASIPKRLAAGSTHRSPVISWMFIKFSRQAQHHHLDARHAWDVERECENASGGPACALERPAANRRHARAEVVVSDTDGYAADALGVRPQAGPLGARSRSGRLVVATSPAMPVPGTLQVCAESGCGQVGDWPRGRCGRRPEPPARSPPRYWLAPGPCPGPGRAPRRSACGCG